MILIFYLFRYLSLYSNHGKILIKVAWKTFSKNTLLTDTSNRKNNVLV